MTDYCSGTACVTVGRTGPTGLEVLVGAVLVLLVLGFIAWVISRD